MSIKISVIVPVYNTAPWLRRCLDSICTQSYRNLEIMCVNDGSTDHSAEILEEYAAKDSRIKVFTQENAGLSAARNTALKHASGEWVTGVDSDDYLYPGVYEKAISCCESGVDLVFFGVKEEAEDGKPLPCNDYFDLPAPGVYPMTPKLAAKLNVCFTSKLWRRSLIEDNALRFPVGLVHEDEAMYYLTCPYAHKIAISPALGYAYMQRQGSIKRECGGDCIKKIKRYIHILEFVHAKYEQRGLLTQRAQKYLKVMFVRLCRDFYWVQPLELREQAHQMISEAIQKCRMQGQSYSLDRFMQVEHRGWITITRGERLAIYHLGRIPIWFTFHTRRGNSITLKLILQHIKSFIS